MRCIWPSDLGETKSLQVPHQGRRSQSHPTILQYLKVNFQKKRSNVIEHFVHPANYLNFVSLDVDFNDRGSG